ncbi:DUF948 domain-containing protein [Virgibacillus necropolis]|uniref:General stress protein n=1 Tax=Virgibacillus necropolis TaxID=163877 RepID=A0A221M7N4_9BACI|nr:DUF948 domain-containing protein [Virgibacillus necropolis]ASN03645.1 general stress protein [Virgibacillus necropolis]
MELVYIGVLLCALGFGIIAIFVAKVLKRISNTLESLGKTLGEVETKLQYITAEIELTIKETDKIVDDVEQKLKATDSLFDTLENVGQSVSNLNTVLHHQTKNISTNKALQQAAPIAHSIQWSEVAFRLFTKWKDPSKKPKFNVKS